MSSLNPPLGPFPSQLPGRVIRKVQRYLMPDGTVREKRWVQITFQAPDGSIQTEEQTEVVPPLSDGVVPEEMTDVLYCLLCQALVCRTLHSFVCQNCGLTFCVQCRVRVKTEDGEIQLCRPCAERVAHPLITKFRKMLWGE